MAYDNPDRRTYWFPALAFGAATVVQTIKVPTFPGGTVGKAGKVVAVGIGDPTVAFATGTTTGAAIKVGDGTTVGKYYASSTVAGVGLDGAAGRGAAADDQIGILADTGAKVDIEQGRSTVTVTLTAQTGGTPAGTAPSYVMIDWF